MSFSTLFTIAIAIILLRVFWLRIKAAGMRNENFKQLPAKDQLAVLKECLLNNPSERNFNNLKELGERQNLTFDMEGYRPFMKRQLELLKRKDALAEDNELYTEEARWLDNIKPLEFEEAQGALKNGDRQTYIQRSLEGIARFYSDEAIIGSLENLKKDYTKAELLLKSYKELIELRDQSGADDKSLERLRKVRDQWESDLLNFEE